MPPFDLAVYLAGCWTVRRTMCQGEERGSFEGVAEFTSDPDGLWWEERGRSRWQGHDGPAHRRLRLVRVGDAWEVRFEDGRLFHALDLATGSCSAWHPCGADRYRGLYRVLGEDAFEVTWRVHGPAKDQEIVSGYRRS